MYIGYYEKQGFVTHKLPGFASLECISLFNLPSRVPPKF